MELEKAYRNTNCSAKCAGHGVSTSGVTAIFIFKQSELLKDLLKNYETRKTRILFFRVDLYSVSLHKS